MSEERLTAASRKRAMIEKIKSSQNLDDARAEGLVDSVLVEANLDRIIRTPRKFDDVAPMGFLIINNCAME